jgi:hypothetical protein
MLKAIRKTALVTCACLNTGLSTILLASLAAGLLVSLPALGQDHNSTLHSRPSLDLGVTYGVERAYLAPDDCGCFWFNGGGADLAVTFWKGVGIAGAFTGDHASNATAGVDANKFAYMAGPRYTYTPWPQKPQQGIGSRWQVFGQGLFGGAHAFDGAFPSSAGLKSSADSFALEAGGGVNLSLSKRFAARVFEAEYVRTALPNNASNEQNDLRLNFGLRFHIGP